MYSEKVILRNLDTFAMREGWMPVAHSIEQVEDFIAYIKSITTVSANQRSSYFTLKANLTQNRAKHIRRWIENEQAMCCLDSSYFESRYGWVIDHRGEVFKFQNRKAQIVFDNLVAEHDELTRSIEFLILKARQLGVCLDPDTKVLTAGLEWKRIDDLKVGDELVAVDEHPVPREGKKAQARRMRTAVIQAKMERIHERVELTLDTGRKIIATPEHPWLSGIRGGCGAKWRKTGDLKVGDTIRRVTNVWEEGDKDDAWLGGFIDGEGCLRRKKCGGTEISVAQVPGDALDHARELFIRRYAPFREEIDSREPGAGSKLGNQKVHKLVINRSEVIFKLLGKTRPVRFIGKHWWDDKELPGKHIGNQWATVTAIRQLERGRVVNIQTTHQTFIAEGVVSHNTTKTALKFVHRVLFVPNTQAVMGSVILDKSELIQRIIETCIEHLPWWLVPQRSKDTKKLIGFGNGSIMSIQSGNQATGIAQGWTPTCIHLSEIGDIPNPKKTIEEGLLPASHSSAKLFLILEGTGNGSVGWQADKWRACKEDWPKGLSRLRPVFIPWPMAPDLYPEPDWLRSNPAPSDWQPLEVTRKHIRRCELYIHSTDYLARVVGKDWKMPRDQQWFWEFKYREYARTHSQKVWFSQMPADDYEALQGKNDLVFDPIVVESVNSGRKEGVQAYAITGNSIDDGFEPHVDEIDYNLPRIRVEWTSNRSQRFDWMLVPLKAFDESNEKKALDKILIFEDPNMQPGHEGEAQDYSIGIDTADGLGHEDEERSALSITRSMKGEEVDEQVAELCSNRINAPQMVGFAACLATWYGKNTRDPRGCKFAIEQRDRPGDDCQLQLKLMGFTFHHIDTRYDNKELKENKGHKEGWFSNAWSVPMLMNRFIDAVVNGWYKPNSRYLIAELGSLERKMAASRGKSKMEHQSGKFDDRVRAAAQSYFTRHAFDVMAERSNRRYRPPSNKLPEIISTPATLALNDYLSQKMMEEW